MSNPNIIATDEDGNDLQDTQVEVNGIVPGSGSGDDGGGSDTDTELDLPSVVVENPDRPPLAALEDTESIETPIRVPDGATLEVFRWGAFDVADGSAPAGLTVELLDGSDTVQTSASTANDQDKTEPIASYENTSGSASICKLRALNGTGGSLGMDGDSSPGVGCVFGYRVN